MALVAESGEEWYEVLPCANPSEWVAKNVMPILQKKAITRTEMQYELHTWLMQFSHAHIIADWPEDIKHFCDLLITGPGKRIDTPKITFEIIRTDITSTLPHNALHDARALRNITRRTIEGTEY